MTTWRSLLALSVLNNLLYILCRRYYQQVVCTVRGPNWDFRALEIVRGFDRGDWVVLWTAADAGVPRTDAIRAQEFVLFCLCD